MKQSDRHSLKDLPSDPAFHRSVEQNVRQIVPSDLWLPALPEVEQLISSRTERLEAEGGKLGKREGSRAKGELFGFEITDRPPSQGFIALKSNASRKCMRSTREGEPNRQSEITYEPKKYHKGDYSSLMKWLEAAVTAIH